MNSKICSVNSLAYLSAIIAALSAVNISAQTADATIPVVVNAAAEVKIVPPAPGRGTGDSTGVTANTEKTLNIKIVARPEPEPLLSSSVSQLPRNMTGSGASIRLCRGIITVNLQAQQYQNAAISLYSINGRRVFNSKVSAAAMQKQNLTLPKTNLAPGVYLLSVKGVNGNSFASRITHTGRKLNINVAFSGVAGSGISGNSTADGADYGEWTIVAAAPGYITQTRKFTPNVGNNNSQQAFTLVPVTATSPVSFTETVKGVSFNMVYVPGGKFTLGCEPGSVSRCPANTTPLAAEVSSYFIGDTTVTRELWNAVMGSTPSGYGLMFTWYDAIEFACRLSQLTGRNYRMQTEAEFEYAAKNHLASLKVGSSEEWAYNTWDASLMGGKDPVGPGSGSHNQKTRRNAQGTGDNITGRLIRSIEGIGPQLRLTLSADTDLPPGYVHPCRIYAPEVGKEPVNSYRDPRWVTGGSARWNSSSFGQIINLMVWEDGTARLETGYGNYTSSSNGQWFTSNNITFVFVPNPSSRPGSSTSPTRYAYIMLSETDASFISSTGGSGRLVKQAASQVEKPAVPNLMRGEALAKSMPDFETDYKMVDMVNMPQSARKQDERLFDGPNQGWLQINDGATHHYRKDVDAEEFRFMVSGTNLANGEWFTVNNTFLRVTNAGFEDTCTYSCATELVNWRCPNNNYVATCVDNPNKPFVYVAEYLYVVTSSGNFMHNSFLGYERGDMRMFTKTDNSSSRIAAIVEARQCRTCNQEIPMGQKVASMYRDDEEMGHSTFVPAPCPDGWCR